MLSKKNSCYFIMLFLFCSFSVSCNMFSSSDKPSEVQDQYLEAIAKANSGDCESAENILKSIADPNDEMKIALGWAQLCIAGIKAGDIAKSLYSYSGSSNNLSVVGILAKTMLPYDGTKASWISTAITSFNNISDNSKRNIETGIARFVKAASLLAAEAGNSSSADLEKADIGPTAGCDSVDCVAGSGGCTAGMSDSNVTSFINEISAAATALGSAGATDLKNLADIISLGLGAGGTQGRCYIFQNTIP